MEPQEPNYQAIWQWIIAHSQEAKRQARWFEEAARASLFDAAEAHAEDRRASKAFVRATVQQFDLASAINQGDIAGYIQRWYPEPTANGPTPASIDSDEIALIRLRAIYDQEHDPLPIPIFDGTNADGSIRWLYLDTKGDDNPPALWRRVLARLRSRFSYQACKATPWDVPDWHQGSHRVGHRPGLFQRPWFLHRRH
jgi:hypothetical protein